MWLRWRGIWLGVLHICAATRRWQPWWWPRWGRRISARSRLVVGFWICRVVKRMRGMAAELVAGDLGVHLVVGAVGRGFVIHDD